MEGVKMKTEFPCDCQPWKDDYTQLERALTLAARYGYRASLAPLRFCMWCGKELCAPVVPAAEPIAPATKKAKATRKKKA